MEEQFDIIIEGDNGVEIFYTRRIPSGCLSERQIEALLQCLASRHLSEDEIVNSFLKRGCSDRSEFLEVQIGKDEHGRGTWNVLNDYNYTVRSGMSQND